MPYDDLRSFLQTLDKEGQLLRIADEVMPEPDIAAARDRRQSLQLAGPRRLGRAAMPAGPLHLAHQRTCPSHQSRRLPRVSR